MTRGLDGVSLLARLENPYTSQSVVALHTHRTQSEREVEHSSGTSSVSAQIGAIESELAANASTSTPGSWTVMLYANGDNLNRAIYDNVIQLEQFASAVNSSVKVVVLYSQPTLLDNQRKYPVFTTGGGTQTWEAPDTTGTALLQPRPGNASPDLLYTSFDLGRSNVGKASTLENFIVSTEAMYPAQNYALILNDHGAGVALFNRDLNYYSSGDYDAQLTPSKLVNALRGAEIAGATVSLLAFDECLMASTEVEYELRGLVPYVVASEELIPGTGFNYITALAPLETNPASVTPVQLADSMVASYGAQYVNDPSFGDTLSAVNTSDLGSVATALRAFVESTSDATTADWTGLRRARSYAVKFGGSDPGYPYRDLGQFLAAVAQFDASGVIRSDATAALDALNVSVLQNTIGRRQTFGLSIVLPARGQKLPRDYQQQAESFLKASDWLEFLKRFQVKGSGPSCSNPVDWAEDNNDPTLATPLGNEYGPNIQVPRLTLPKGDIDWYQFSIDTTGGPANKIVLSGSPSPDDVQMYLYGQDYNKSPLESGRESVSLDGLRAGLYFLEVIHGQPELSFAYSLTIDAPPAYSEGNIPDSNSSLSTALNIGVLIDEGLITTTDQSGDIYSVFNRVSASSSSYYQFQTQRSLDPMSGEITVLGGSSTYRVVTLYNQSGEPIRQVSGQGNIDMPFTASGNGESYYISVGGAPGTYEMFFSGLS